MSDVPEKSVTKMYGSTLLALGGGGWVSNFQKKALCSTSMAPCQVVVRNNTVGMISWV